MSDELHNLLRLLTTAPSRLDLALAQPVNELSVTRPFNGLNLPSSCFGRV